MGGIYGGVFTPTESAAIGCIATLAVGLARRTLRGVEVRTALLGTAETTAMIFVILLGAEVFNAFLALSQAPDLLAVWITEQDFPPYGVLALLLFSYIVLGAVMDELAMILLTLPVFFPVVTALDFGLATTEETAIWFGVLVLVVVGIGLTAPPIGLNVFVVIRGRLPVASIHSPIHCSLAPPPYASAVSNQSSPIDHAASISANACSRVSPCPRYAIDEPRPPKLPQPRTTGGSACTRRS